MIAPKKHLGQNFLINERIVERIIQCCDLDNNDDVFEIGPGKGVLTRHIYPNVQKLTVIEKDRRCSAYLKTQFSKNPFDIIEEDVLTFDWSRLPPHTKVIGNLPYNISSPIIEKIITHRNKISSFYIMTQLEFAHRLVAQPDCKAYGSLSCFVQFYTSGKILFKINKTAFKPAPKVTSAFLAFEVRKKPAFNVKNEIFLFQMIRQSFSQRRKMLLNTLSGFTDKEVLRKHFKTIKLQEKARAENCSLKQFCQLADLLR